METTTTDKESAKMKKIARLTVMAAAVGLALGLAGSAQAQQDNLTWSGSITGWLEYFSFPYSGPIGGCGVATVSGAAPRTVNVARGDFYNKDTYAVPSTAHVTGFPYSTSWHTLYNGNAKFFAGGGPGATTFNPPAAVPPRYGTIKVTPKTGGNQFGGTLSLLGVWRSFVMSAAYFGGYYAGYFTNNLGTVTPTTGPTFARTTVAQGTFTHTTLSSITFNITAIASLGGWTTGTVQVKAPAPIYTSTQTVAGYDNRTAGGIGNLQVVTGFLTHYMAGTTPIDDAAAYYVLNMHFKDPSLVPSVSAPALGLLSLMVVGCVAVVHRRRRH